jgi:alanyl-tRNA synthetase
MHALLKKFYTENGYIEKLCQKCTMPFWQKNYENFVNCGELGCINKFEYVSSSTDLPGLRREVKTFFQEKGYLLWKKFPLNSSWKEDTLFTQAGIYVFYNDLENQEFLPQKKLLLLQPCLRLTDQKSERHLLTFEMIGLHEFNFPREELYSKITTHFGASHAFFSSQGLGRNTVKFSFWDGGSFKGPCVEIFFAGIEIRTLVIIDQNETEKLSSPAIDIGFGLERILMVKNKAQGPIRQTKYGELVFKTHDLHAIEEAGTIFLLLSQKIFPSGRKEGSIVRKLITGIKHLSKSELYTIYLAFKKTAPIPLIEFTDIYLVICDELDKYKTKQVIFDKEEQKNLKNNNVINQTILDLYHQTLGVPLDIIHTKYPNYHPTEQRKTILRKKAAAKDIKILQRVFEYKAEVKFLENEKDLFKYQILNPQHRFRFGGQEADPIFIDDKSCTQEYINQDSCIIFTDSPLSAHPIIKIDKVGLYKIRQLHTLAHVFNGFFEKGLCYINGSSIKKEYASLDLLTFTKPEINDLSSKIQEILDKKLVVFEEYIGREEFESGEGPLGFNTNLILTNYSKLKIVTIENWDTERCSGDHVKNLAEISGFVILKIEKIKEKVFRIYYTCN